MIENPKLQLDLWTLKSADTGNYPLVTEKFTIWMVISFSPLNNEFNQSVTTLSRDLELWGGDHWLLNP